MLLLLLLRVFPGFTAHPSAAVQAPGTYLGLIEKLDYLKELGVNAIELLPVSVVCLGFGSRVSR